MMTVRFERLSVIERLSLGQKGALIAFGLIFAVCLCWPIFYTGYAITFADTRSYLRGGEKIWEVLLQLIPATDVAPGGGSSEGVPEAFVVNPEGQNVVGRSFPYSTFAYAFFQLGDAFAWALAQAGFAVIMIAFLLSREALKSPIVLAIGALFVATLTGLPWYASFLMPDIFGAFVVLFGILLVRDVDRLGLWASAVLVLLAGFSAMAHYGHMPLIAVTVGAALAVRLLRHRLSWKSIAMGAFAIALAPAANLTASAVVLDDASVTPKRLPILLARSLADGPALWYIQDVCPEAELAICEAFGTDINTDTNWFLFSDEGVLSLSAEQLDRIRDEEMRVVVGAFLAYPFAQASSLFSNAAHALVKVGITELAFAEDFAPDFEREMASDPEAENFRATFDRIIPLATLASALIFSAFGVAGRLSPRWIDMLALLIVAWAANAMIFGGLSAPIDRYQGRLAWLVPVLLVVFLAELSNSRRERTASG